MGEVVSILLPAALLLVPAIAIYWQSRKPKPYEATPGCPECHHETGLNATREHCEESFDDGWGLTDCTCQNDYHWRRRDRDEAPSPTPPVMETDITKPGPGTKLSL